MQKFLKLTFALVWMAGSAANTEDKSPTVQWRTGLVAGFDEAHRSQKPVVMYIRRVSNGKPMALNHALEVIACGDVERDLFSHPEFQKLADQAVFIRYDVAEIDPKGPAAEFMQATGVDRFPAFLVFDVPKPQLQIRKRILGRGKTREYLSALRPALAKIQRTPAPDEKKETPAAGIRAN